MKKRLLLLLLCFTYFPLHSGEFLSEFKIGYFRPTNDILRDIFPDGWANYQLEVSYSPFSRCCKDWWRGFFAWGSVNYLHADGESNIGVDDCSIKIIPAAAGIKYMLPLPCCTQAYAGAGLKYFWLRLDTRDDLVHLKDRARGLGGVFTIGAIFHPVQNVFMDFFVDYSLKHFDKNNFSVRESNIIPSAVDISGITVGVGFGLWF